MKKFLLILAISLITTLGFSQTIEEQLETTTQELIETTQAYEDLYGEYDSVSNQLEETTQALEDSQELIKSLRDELVNSQDIIINTQKEVILDQEEIIGLRKEIMGLIVPPESILRLGVGYLFPNEGVNVLLNVNIPRFPVGIYGSGNFYFDKTFIFSVGLMIDI